MKKLRIGIMGCASIARRYVFAALRGMPEYEVAAVASRDASKAVAFSKAHGGEPVHGYDKLVAREDIDAVYVPLPTGLHAEWVRQLLEAGKHVMVEKSLAMNLADAQSLAAIAQRKNLVLMEHFQFVHHRQTAFVLDLLARGAIGELRALRASFGFPPLDPSNFRYSRELGGGALLDAGAYTLRTSQLYLGTALDVRAAMLGGDPSAAVETRGAAFLVSDKGVPAELAWGFEHFYQCAVELWGSKGRILQDRAFTAPPGYSPVVVVETEGQRVEHQIPADNHFVNLWREFHLQVTGGGDRAASLAAVLTQARLIEDVRRMALAKGRP